MTYKGKIEVDENSLQLPLVPLFAGKLSSMVVSVANVPTDVTDLALVVARTDDADGKARDPFKVAATKQDDGTFRVYCNPYCFPDEAANLWYSLVGTDESGNPRWLGTGKLKVLDNPANGSAVAPTIIPQDCYAYNPTTGKYHKITASLDEYGNISLDVESEGVNR